MQEASMAIQIKRYDDNDQLIEVLKSIGRSDDFSITPDDRIELVQTINGVTIADGGRFPIGDRYTMTAVFDAITYNKLKTVWATREDVDVVFDDGTTLVNAVVLVKGISFYDKIMPQYKKVQLEIFKRVGVF